MAKSKFNPAFYQNFTTNDKGELTYDDNTWKQIDARNAAIKKIEDTNALKKQIQDETNAAILESQKEISQKGSNLMKVLGGVQTYANPSNWARGVVGLGKIIVEDVTTPFVTGSKSWSEQNTATNLYNQSKDLADQAAKIVKTDRPQAEALLKQSQALAQEANKFSQGEATKTIMGADDKLTGKEIFAKSALAGLTAGSFLPVGSVAKGSFMLAKTVPAAVQGSKTVTAGNIITRFLGLGDIYQVTKTGVQQGFKQEVKQSIVGQAGKATLQAPAMAGLYEMADDDGVNNYGNSVLTTATSAFGLTLGFGYAGGILGSVAQAGVSDISKIFNKTGVGAVTDLAGALPMPPASVKPVPESQKLLPLPQEAVQATTTIDGKVVNLPPSAYSQSALDPNVFEPKAKVIGTTVNKPLPNMYASLGAFNPETDIPMVDLTETIKANNIDFNPDSVMSINATRKTVDDIALLNGNEVGGKKLKINTEDPKYKEVYNNMIKPLVDKINKVDEGLDVPSVKVDPLVEEAKKYKSAEEFVKTQGEPVYHGTNVEFKKFDPKKINTIESSGDYVGSGFYFTDSVDKAKKYSLQAVKKFGGKEVIKEAYLEIKNPLIINSKDDISKLNNLFGGEESRIELLIDNPNAVKEKLQSLGYDGLIDNVYGQRAVFDTNQIKTKSQLEEIYNKAQSQPETPTLSKIPVEEEVPKTIKLWNKSKFSDDGAYVDVPIIRREDNITLYQGSKPGEKRQYWTPDKKYAERFGDAKEKTGSFYRVDNGNRVTDVYVEVPETPTLSKIPIEEVELEVQKIYSELENAGIPITPEKVRNTPTMDKVNEKLARGEQSNPEEFDAGMKEYVNSTGKTEVIDGVQEELTGPMKKSAYVERLNRENPGLNLSSVEYQAAVVKDLEAIANDLIDNNFDEAGRIAKSINKDSSVQDIKIGELYINKLIELGKKDELAQVYHTFSSELTRLGQKTGILQEKKMGTPQYAIKQAQDKRMSKIQPEVEKQVAVVKQEMSSVAVDQNFISDILDNITCR